MAKERHEYRPRTETKAGHQFDALGSMYLPLQQEHAYGKLDGGRLFLLRHLRNGIPTGKNLVDVGCGGGKDLAAYMKLGFRDVQGVDPSVVMVAAARKETGNPASVTIGSWERLPFDDNSKDVLIGRYSFQFVDNIDGAYTEAARVLKSGGELVLVLPDLNAFAKNDAPHVEVPIFNKKMTLLYPRRDMREYISNKFRDLFQLIDQFHERGNGQPDSVVLVARKR